MAPFLGNRRSGEFHDLARERPGCQIAEIPPSRRVTFTPDTLEQAIREGFEPCGWCLGTFADLNLVPFEPVPSAADLAGRDLGGGRAELEWTHALDPATHEIVFDVYVSPDPLEPFRRLAAGAVTTLGVEISGLSPGEVYVCVVARRGEQLALPSALLALSVSGPLVSVETAPAGAGPEPVGLAFPFRTDAAGGIHAEGGDPLLRGKVLQLLLTNPGERVCEPEYGTRLTDLVFDPQNEVLAAATEFAVGQALRRWLGDQLAVDEVRVRSEEAELAVDVTYVRTADLSTERLRVGIPIPR